MSTTSTIRAEREQILKELAALEQIRRGSVTEQYVQTTAPDGQSRRRGPYPLYTFKEHGQTVSRRLRDPQQVTVYRQQISQWRRFHELVERLRVLGETGSEMALQATAVKKTPNTRLKRNWRPHGSSNV